MVPKKLAIDLGTSNSSIYVKKKGIITTEPTVVAVSEENSEIMSIGEDARKMLGRTPEDIIALRPMKSGVIADYGIARVFISYFINKALSKSKFFKPEAVVSIPVGATSVESKAVLDSVHEAGAKKVYLVPGPLAAAIGAGSPVSQPSGNVIMTLGGGISEIGVISLYGIVVHGSVRVGGIDFDRSIAQYLRREHGLIVGEETAELVKIEIGDALQNPRVEVFEVKGRDSVTGFPRIVEITSEDIYPSLEMILEKIASTTKDVLERTPPELSSDILDKGIVLSGRTSMLKNIDKYISNYVGVPVHVAEEPGVCVINGLGRVLDHLDEFSKSMIKV